MRADEGTRTLDLQHGKDSTLGDTNRQEPPMAHGSVVVESAIRHETPASDTQG